MVHVARSLLNGSSGSEHRTTASGLGHGVAMRPVPTEEESTGPEWYTHPKLDSLCECPRRLLLPPHFSIHTQPLFSTADKPVSLNAYHVATSR